MNFRIGVNETDLAHKLFVKAPDEFARGSSAAINRTLTHMRAEISKAVRSRYTAKAKDIKGTFKLKKATPARLTGEVWSQGRPLPLAKFKISSRSKSRPLKVAVLKSGGAKPVKGLFINPSSSGKYSGFLYRYRKTRYPLRIPYGPSVPQMVGNEQVLPRIVEGSQTYLKARFLHEIEYRLSRL